MKKYICIVLFAVAWVGAGFVLQRQFETVKEDRDTYKQNTHTLE